MKGFWIVPVLGAAALVLMFHFIPEFIFTPNHTDIHVVDSKDYKTVNLLESSDEPTKYSIEIGKSATYGDNVEWPACRKIRNILYQHYRSLGTSIQIIYTDEDCVVDK